MTSYDRGLQGSNIVVLSLIAMVGVISLFASGALAETSPSAGDCIATIKQACSDNLSLSCSSDEDCVAGTCGTVQTDADCPAPESGMAAATAVIANARRLGPDCDFPGAPAGSIVKRGDQCVLTGDTSLNSTMEMESFAKLNCQGHKLSPYARGDSIANRSKPEVGILLDGAYGARIQNCVIDGFDFGIFAMDSKLNRSLDPGSLELLGNDIINNTINARFVSIELLSVDNARIKDNDISFSRGNGLGVLILRDSSGNQVKNNTISLDPGSAVTSAVRLPGPASASNPINAGSSGGIYMTQGTGFPNLLNAIVGGELRQFPNEFPITSFNENNTIEGNAVSSSQSMNDVAATNSRNVTIRGNDLSTANNAIIFGGLALPSSFPGRCTGNTGRLCLADSDCDIRGYDNASQGNCANVTQHDTATISDGALIEGNRITGPFSEAVQISTPNISVIGNNITGPVSNPASLTSAAIEVRGRALMTAVIERNSVSNVNAPLRLFNQMQFGAKVSLNDFTGYAYAVLAQQGYSQPTELSAEGRGNYWGLACPGFDPNLVRRDDGSVNPSIVDSHPYNVSVAGTPDGSLPPTCQ